MRDRSPATLATLDQEWPGALLAAGSGRVTVADELERRARAYLASRVAAGRLSVRSVVLYATHVAHLIVRYSERFGTVASPSSTEALSFFRTLLEPSPTTKEKTKENDATFEGRLHRALLRLLVSANVFYPTLGREHLDDIPREAAGVPDAAAGVPELYFVDRAARKLVSVTKSLVATRLAPDTLVLRTALVAMCRWAGALPSDLAALTFADLEVSPDASPGTPADASRRWRVASRLNSAPAGTESLLLIGAFAELALGYWLQLRARITNVDHPAPGDPVFIHLQLDALRQVATPLTRREVSKIISGENREFFTGTEDLWDPATLAATKTPSEILPDGPPELTEYPDKVYISAQRLRDCQILALVRAIQDSTPALDEACTAALGTRCTLPRSRMRRLLGLTERTPESRPRKPRKKAGRAR
ncbi:MAG: hypothetical protein H3C62_02320 [Gemmatimonadaceae bacterium]|nr:hypothetical protein [Gemmatimonadaceae bacterium]